MTAAGTYCNVQPGDNHGDSGFKHARLTHTIVSMRFLLSQWDRVFTGIITVMTPRIAWWRTGIMTVHHARKLESLPHMRDLTIVIYAHCSL